MPALYTWSNTLEFGVTVPGSQVQFFPYTYPIFPPKSLQRFVVRTWVTGSFGRSGSGPQEFPRPYDWSLSVYVTDTAGLVRNYYNGGWQEALTGWADADVGGWNTVGTAVGPGPLEVDQDARRAAPAGPGAELDLHVDLLGNPNASQWTAAVFDFERHFWLDVSYLTSEPGI